MLFEYIKSQPAVDSTTSDIRRDTVEYIDGSQRFAAAQGDFSKQYSFIYSARLSAFRNILSPLAKKKWSKNYNIYKLCELHEKGTTCIIIGTLFKIQELKPSILKELSDQLEIIPQPTRTHFVHDLDSVVLEDELQRIKLIGDCIDVHQIVTGVICAVLGSEDEDGYFRVKDLCYAGCNVQKPLPTLNDQYIVFMSGLNLASKSAEHLFSLQLFMEWVSGLIGTTKYQDQIAKVIRVIIAGGIYAINSNDCQVTEEDIIECADSVDTFCETLSSFVPLDIMPGCKDPTGVMLPQKPFHYCMFPKASQYKSFSRVTNPYEFNIEGLLCLGTSGESIKDIKQFSKLENDLIIMKKTLEWRHIAPSCPDTVPCMPCTDVDPFIIYECPAIYFSGNCDKFSTDIYCDDKAERIRLVCIPDFYKTRSVAVVNLRNLDCYSVKFS